MFYDTLIDIESFREMLPVGNSARFCEVRKRAFSILGTSIMAMIFERLPKPDRDAFARELAADTENPANLQFLVQRIGPTIEDDIRTEFANVMRKLAPLLATVYEEPQ